VDYTFIFREHDEQENSLWYYARMFATFDDFCQVMDQCTNNYECLVIDNTSSLTDQVFWYKAEPQSDFKMCNPAFWKLVLSWKNRERWKNCTTWIRSGKVNPRSRSSTTDRVCCAVVFYFIGWRTTTLKT
jgi:hypothetical protein